MRSFSSLNFRAIVHPFRSDSSRGVSRYPLGLPPLFDGDLENLAEMVDLRPADHAVAGTGHGAGDVARQYGQGPSLHVRKAAIEQLNIDFIDKVGP